jgi:hypothetical protein
MIEAAEQVLAEHVELIADLSFSDRATVLRLRLSDGGTVIAKQHVADSGHRSEVLALRMLPHTVSPNLLASSDDIMIMEDLGDGPSVADLLLGTDATAAHTALVLWARSLGRIAAATSGLEPATDTIRHEIILDVNVFAELAQSWGVELPAGLANELHDAQSRLKASGLYRTLVVSDAACPDNNRVTDKAVRFFDFEFACWSHAAIDAAYCLAPFCTCWCVAGLPDAIRRTMFDAYCDEFPTARSSIFRRAAVIAGIGLTLSGLLQSSKEIRENPRLSIEDDALLKPSQHFRLRLEWLATQESDTPTVATLASRLLEKLDQRFPGVVVPTYPAFADLDNNYMPSAIKN